METFGLDVVDFLSSLITVISDSALLVWMGCPGEKGRQSLGAARFRWLGRLIRNHLRAMDL